MLYLYKIVIFAINNPNEFAKNLLNKIHTFHIAYTKFPKNLLRKLSSNQYCTKDHYNFSLFYILAPNRLKTFHKTRWKQSRPSSTLLCPLIPSIVALLMHVDDIVHLQLQLIVRVRRIRCNASEPLPYRLHRRLPIRPMASI